jgi:hypothetical protein
MRAADLARFFAVGLWAFVGAGPATGCGWGHHYCHPEEYVAIGPEVESVEECPPFPASCPIDCDATEFYCTQDGLRCEDCARVQAWIDQNREEFACIQVSIESSFPRGFRLFCVE